jgi:rhodanese-related sulfurtransferase
MKNSLSQKELEEYFFLDVREESEFEEKSIEGSFNLPSRKVRSIATSTSLGFWEGKIPKDKTIVVYCATGKRAKLAAEALLKKKFKVLDLQTFEQAEDYHRAVKDKKHGK